MVHIVQKCIPIVFFILHSEHLQPHLKGNIPQYRLLIGQPATVTIVHCTLYIKNSMVHIVQSVVNFHCIRYITQ